MNQFIISMLTLLSITCTPFVGGSITPNYELVSIKWHKMQKRSTHSTIPLSLKVFNNRINLNLKPVDDIIINSNTPIYNIKRVNSLLNVKAKKLFDDIRMEIYEDEKNFASVVVNIYPNGMKAIENAIIGVYNLIIRPATKSDLLKLGKNNTSHDMNHLYVVYTHQQESGHFSNPLGRINTIDETFPRRLLNIPDVIYPEILIIIDYYLAKNLGQNSIVPYVLAFWNQVDLMYRSLNNPKYRINIAGIVIPMNLQAVDFISNVRPQYGSNQSSFKKILRQCFKWLYNHQKFIPIHSYDVAITMTSAKSESTTSPVDTISGKEIGLAMVSGACQIHHGTKNVFKAGMIFDNGDFSGVATAAHELGHTLGAYHDSGVSCPEQKGYLMSPVLSTTIHRFKWSKCSLEYFQNFLKTNPICLFNKPT